MTREEFIKRCALLGLSIPMQPILASCSSETDDGASSFEGNVLIIGAGAAGLTAAYQLQQLGIDYQLLEASSTYGGHMKHTLDFVDFPISLGAEWLHVEKGVLGEIVNDSSIPITT
ncbi:MAG: NAD(P)-binding protein, partial [Bacteroidota bacterium]